MKTSKVIEVDTKMTLIKDKYFPRHVSLLSEEVLVDLIKGIHPTRTEVVDERCGLRQIPICHFLPKKFSFK